MTTITVENAKFTKTHFSNEKDHFLYIMGYIHDLETKESVKNEIKNDDWYRITLDNFLKCNELLRSIKVGIPKINTD